MVHSDKTAEVATTKKPYEPPQTRVLGKVSERTLATNLNKTNDHVNSSLKT